MILTVKPQLFCTIQIIIPHKMRYTIKFLNKNAYG